METSNKKTSFIKTFLMRDVRTTTLVVMLMALMLFFSILNPSNFPSISNFRSMMLQMAENGIFVLAMYIIMISGGLNLSIVMLANMAAAAMAMVTTGMILGETLTSPVGRILVGVIAALVTGALGGALNGLFVSHFGLNALLVTTATSQLFEGVAQLITKGGSIVNTIPSVVLFGNGYIFGLIPNVFALTLLCYLIAAIFANKTKYGETSRLLGANAVANQYCGNNNKRTLMTAFIMSGIFSAVGGIVVFCKMGIVRSEYGSTLSSQALLTLVLAGLLLIGGMGKVSNVLISLSILQIISSGLNLAGITTYMKSVCWGFMLILIVLINSQVFKEEWNRHKRKRQAKSNE